MKTFGPRRQLGVFLIEAMIAILIFSIGILSMISMQAVSVAAQNDSQYRVEAEHLIDQFISQVRVAVGHDTATGAVDAASFASFAHQPTGTACPFSGTANTTNAIVTGWIATVRGNSIPGKGLPDVTDPRVQILTSTATAGLNQMRITVCWQAKGDRTPHSHSVVAYID